MYIDSSHSVISSGCIRLTNQKKGGFYAVPSMKSFSAYKRQIYISCLDGGLTPIAAAEFSLEEVADLTR